MKYIQFYNLYTESFWDGFLVSENEEYFYWIDPICYEWLVKTDNLKLMEFIEPRRFEKDYFSYFDKRLPENWSFVKGNDWFFDFPLTSNNLKHLLSISNFFEWVIGSPNEPFHQRIQTALSRTKFTLSPEIQDDLEEFFRKHPNRLRYFKD